MVVLRETPVDDPDAAKLLAEYVAMRAAGFPGSYLPAMPVRATFEGEAGVFVVAYDEESGAAVGCGGIRRIDDGPAGPRDEVKHLFVRPGGRGRGWGRSLLADLERRARARGGAELVLDTHHTLVEAGGLYAAFGFVEIEPYNTNPNATVWLGKVLR